MLNGCIEKIRFVRPTITLPDPSHGLEGRTTTKANKEQDLKAILRTHSSDFVIMDLDFFNRFETGYTKCRENEISIYKLIQKYNDAGSK